MLERLSSKCDRSRQVRKVAASFATPPSAFDLRCNFSVDFCNSVGVELVCKVFRLHVPFSQVLKQPKVQRYSQGLEYAHASVFGKSGVKVKAFVPVSNSKMCRTGGHT